MTRLAARFEASIKIDSLGYGQQPIVDAVMDRLPGSNSAFAPLPVRGAALVVYWAGFAEYNDAAREAMVRDVIGTLGGDAQMKVSSVLALTPDEAAEMDHRFGYKPWRAQLFATLKDNIDSDAGRLLDGEGEYENVGFGVAAAYKPRGDKGYVLMVINLLTGVGRARQVTIESNWRWGDPAKVAAEAIANYHDLRSKWRIFAAAGKTLKVITQ
jgi:hypothetical protein